MKTLDYLTPSTCGTSRNEMKGSVFIMGLALGAALVLLIEDLQRLIQLGDMGEVVKQIE